MPGQSAGIDVGRLERSCDGGAVAEIVLGRPADGIERAAAFFRGPAFAPHRHDTYAIGVTVRGVQKFRYRGETRTCLPGQLHVLHPDETHDGGPGTDAGFAYRILYIDPALIGASLGGRPLPFVADPVVGVEFEQAQRIAAIVADIDQPIDAMARADIAVAIADGLHALAGSEPKPDALDLAAVSRVRALLIAEPARAVRMERLEEVTGLDRWTLSRQFRAAFGTSPHRFRTLRRLDLARRLMATGAPLADAAAAAGFADQSHLTRQFKRAYGLTPARWLAATKAGRLAA